MFDFGRWSTYHWVGLINKLLVFQMQLYLCGNTYTCMCKNKPSKSYYGIMDVWRGIWYSNFSACKEIYCIEEQTDHRTTFPRGKRLQAGKLGSKNIWQTCWKAGGKWNIWGKVANVSIGKSKHIYNLQSVLQKYLLMSPRLFLLIISMSWQAGGVTRGLVSESLAAIAVAVALSLPLPLRHMRSSCLRMANLQFSQYYSCPKTNNTNCKNCDIVESWCLLKDQGFADSLQIFCSDIFYM